METKACMKSAKVSSALVLSKTMNERLDSRHSESLFLHFHSPTQHFLCRFAAFLLPSLLPARLLVFSVFCAVCRLSVSFSSGFRILCKATMAASAVGCFPRHFTGGTDPSWIGPMVLAGLVSAPSCLVFHVICVFLCSVLERCWSSGLGWL